MAPEFRLESLKQKYDYSKAKKAGVLILFYPDGKANTRFVLILRKTYKGVHSNQVALPGGRYEIEDGDLIQTALRETEEEIGVDSTSIQVIRPLTELFIPPSNFLVQPTLASIDYTPIFIKQEDEVEDIISVDLSEFLMQSKVQLKIIKTSYADQKEVQTFHINGYTVWGATAMMLSELKIVLKSAGLFNAKT